LVRISNQTRHGLESKPVGSADSFYSFLRKRLRESAVARDEPFFEPNAHIRPLMEGRILFRVLHENDGPLATDNRQLTTVTSADLEASDGKADLF
jgi:hypothetical protein